MMERAKDALRAFDEAASLGAPEQALAADRGLAHDLEGDGKKAQRDYQTALRAAASDEVTRRYALSQGINGEKDAALSRLEPLVLRNDQGAWRARAFILAMNNDLPGAERIVRMVAPAESAAAMVGFMQRLASLNAGAKAHAVHFGTLPGSGQTASLAEEDGSFSPLDQTSAARLATSEAPKKVANVSGADAREARRFGRQEREAMRVSERSSRPADTAEALTSRPVVAAPAPSSTPLPSPAPAAIANPVSDSSAQIVASASVERGAATYGPPAASVADARPTPQPAASVGPAVLASNEITNTPPPLFEVPPAAPPRAPESVSQPLKQSASSSSVSSPASISAKPVTAQVEPATSGGDSALVEASAPKAAEGTPPTARPVAPRFVLADVVRTLELEPESAAVALPDEARLKALRIAAQKKAAAEEKARAEKAEADRRAAEAAALARRNPARVWVQIATGGNMSGLSHTWRQIKDQAPKTLSDQRAWYVPYRQTNRIVVGPVGSMSEARKMVNQLAKEGVTATVFSSEAGQEVERIGGK
jgi:hypothetical protein